MLRVRLIAVLQAVMAGTTGFAVPALAQIAGTPGDLGVVTLPGGLRPALAVIGDRAQPDHSQFLLEVIRRAENRAAGDRDIVLRPLLAHLDAESTREPTAGAALPLPLPTQIWIDVVFKGRATPNTLVAEILRSRPASLFYYGLLSLDEGTRAWLATEPALIAELATKHPAAFLIAAPGLRVAGGAVLVPGGEAAAPSWEALVGRRRDRPVEFIRALAAEREGRLAYFFGALAQLTAAQTTYTLNLEAPDPAARIAAARRLSAAFDGVAGGWKAEERPLWRPPLDPALLVADLNLNGSGRPVLPGTRSFWSAVFANDDPNPAAPEGLAAGEGVNFAWLCEQVFRKIDIPYRNAYHVVLFASRVIGRITPATAFDAVVAVRAAHEYPALMAILERAGLHDVAALASAARRATRISAIDDQTRAARALAQFQGALALVSRAAARGSVPPGALPSVISSLAAVDTSARGDYDGRLVQWLAAFVDAHPDGVLKARLEPAANDEDPWAGLYAHAVGPLDRDTVRLMSRTRLGNPPIVEWEGTRYRVDLGWAEATRLARVLGDDPRPYLSSARALVAVADVLGEAGLTRERLEPQSTLLGQVVQSGRWEPDILTPLQRTARVTNIRDAARLVATLHGLADELLARGLVTLAYAAALGQPHPTISAGEVASRHDFRPRRQTAGPAGAWRLPTETGGGGNAWHVTGSVLGLDVQLAGFSLVRLSTRPPLRKPTLNDEDRRAFIEAVAIVEPSSLSDEDRDLIVAAMKQGRARVAGVRTAREAAVLAEEIRLTSARRSLLAWVVDHESARAPTFLSPSELLWLGLEKRPVEARLHAWGAPGRSRVGCLCLRLGDRQPWEMFAGRWGSGIFASGFPDLNLRLAELLAELRMPAPLLDSVLASATLDLVNTVDSRHPDDRRGIIEFVQALGIERMEQYLALLTTGGPLVPVDEAAGSETDGAVGRSTGGRCPGQ